MPNLFFKYQSLGNDFILFDWYKKDESDIHKILNQPTWKEFVINSCKRHFGIGADGILIFKKNEKLNLPEALIFNSDGSQAEICLNGLRCICKHLYTNHNFASKFKLKMGPKIIECAIEKNDEIINTIESANYIENKTIEILDEKIQGHVIDAGNPHFVIFEKTNLEWLQKNGPLIENHNYFKNQTNVEFIWQDENNNIFNVLVYERGCGITLACSSGATAIIWTLFYLKKIKAEEKIILQMPGGNITGWINEQQKIVLQATANFVFKGSKTEKTCKPTFS